MSKPDINAIYGFSDPEDEEASLSEIEVEKSKGSRPTRKRKLDDVRISIDAESEDDEQSDNESFNLPASEEELVQDFTPKAKEKGTKLAALDPRSIEEANLAVRRSGVIYLSRIPPYMKPQKVRHLLSKYGEIGRLFISPEDPKDYYRRVKSGGSKKHDYVEGWAEFKDKRIGKMVASTLNATNIGGKKGNYYYDDLWNIKYLHNFKWHHLTEQISYENASRQSRLRAEISQATRENKTFIRNVERAKMVENMKSRKRVDTKNQNKPAETTDIRRQFRQRTIKDRTQRDEDEVQRLENIHCRIFG